jgi:1-phosphatidylinositol-4-phosphate 5-kinase
MRHMSALAEQDDSKESERECRFMVEGVAVSMYTVSMQSFGRVRKVFGVLEDEVAGAVAEGVSGGVSQGKSGSFIFFTLDNKFVIKSVSAREAEFLEKKMMPEYAKYMEEFPHSLIPRLYGMYRILSGGNGFRVLVMNNVLQTSLEIMERYDLKGSTVGRAASKKEKLKYGKDTIMKDLDFEFNGREIKLARQTKISLILQLENDVRFLKSMGVMDYSLFLGIHFYGDDWKLPPALCDVENSAEDCDNAHSEAVEDSPHYMNLPQENQKLTLLRSKADSFQDFKERIKEQSLKSVDAEQDAGVLSTKQGPRSPKKSVSLFKSEEGGMRSRRSGGELLNEHYFMGIIDILQTYDVTKVLETGVKSIKHNKDKLSSVDPNQYGDRFLNFVKSIVQ